MSIEVVYYKDKNNRCSLCLIKRGLKFITGVHLDPEPKMFKVKVEEAEYMTPVPERYNKPLIVKQFLERAKLEGVKKFIEQNKEEIK